MAQYNRTFIIVTVAAVLCRTNLVLGLPNGIIFRDEDIDKYDTVCNTPNGDMGECISITKCPKLLALFSQRSQRDFLKQSHCNWDGNIPWVCCPSDTPTTTQQPLDCSNFKMERCGQVESECCPAELVYNAVKASTSTSTSTPSIGKACELTSLPPEPSSGCCGLEVRDPVTMPNGTTLIDQNPWTAIILYVEKSGRNVGLKALCGGVLISARYVLTAAHCLTFDDWKPFQVRLGDYDIDNSEADCVETPSGGVDCTPGAVSVAVDVTTQHPDYKATSRAQNNDIGLVRLSYNAPYTDFIRPICLPSATDDFTTTASNETKLYLTGSGFFKTPPYRSSVKLELELSFIPDLTCFSLYRQRDIILDDGRMCAQRTKLRDLCKGDSGGPLIQRKNEMAEIVGISSYPSCYKRLRPEVFTKVHYHLEWIKRVMH